MSNVSRPVIPSAAAHAARIKDLDDAAAGEARAGRSTAQMYADQILPGYRADEELREKARLSELRARGVITADIEPEDAEEEYDDEYEEETDVEEEAPPPSTAERYAAVERKRQAAEHEANARAQASMTRAAGRPLAPQRPPVVVQPHRYAHLWQKPAS